MTSNTLQTVKHTHAMPVTGQILRSPKQWPKSLVIGTELNEVFFFRKEHKSGIDGVKGWSGVTVMEVKGTAECMQILIEMQLMLCFDRLWHAYRQHSSHQLTSMKNTCWILFGCDIKIENCWDSVTVFIFFHMLVVDA